MRLNISQSFFGLFAVIGNWPNWEDYFDLSSRGLRHSFMGLILTLPAFYLIAAGVHGQALQSAGQDFTPISWQPVIRISAIFLFYFSLFAYGLTIITRKADAFRPWVITRHWAIFYLAWTVAGFFALFLLGFLPFTMAYGTALAAYLGSLAIDIRLLYKVAGFEIGAAILLACLLVATGLTLIMFSLDYV